MDEDNQDYHSLELLLATRAQAKGRDRKELVRKMRELPHELMLNYFRSYFFVRVNEEQHLIKITQEIPPAIACFNQPWAIITAYNPYSVEVGEEENRLQQQNMESLLMCHGYTLLLAIGRSRDRDWEEPSILVLGISYAMAKAFGSCFRQNAVLFSESGGPIELIMCDK